MSEVTFRDKTELKPNKTFEEFNEFKVNRLDELKIGDHVIIVMDEHDFSHAILSSIDLKLNTIELIYYDDSEIQCSLNKYIHCDLKAAVENCTRKGIKSCQIEVDFKQFEIYRVVYELNNQKILTPEETIEKARRFVGNVKYNIFMNNDEHFAVFCKTGKAAKLFVISPNDLTGKKIIGKDLSDKIVGSLAEQGGKILLVNTARHIATKFPRSAVTAALPAAAEAAGSALGIGIEGISTSYDIYKKHKELKEGKINNIKFKKYVAKRVTRGTMTVAGGFAGGFVGQMVIPIPVVGAVVGGIVGGLVGAAIGQGEGILLGELVEIIDDKIQEKRRENVKLAKSKYEVLDKLVIKFKEDILKPESWNELSGETKKNEMKFAEANVLKSGEVLLNAGDKINNEDYEIFVLNDSNEIVTGLNLDSVLDSNGAIFKRSSIEAFSTDQIPDEINVFFKFNENSKN